MLAFNHLGRLGFLANQMFQYAAIKGIASHNKMEYMIPEDHEMQLASGFEMKNATEIRGFLGDPRVRDGRGAPVSCQFRMEEGFHFDEELFNNPPSGDVSLYGFFQTDKYYKHIWDEVLEDFTFKPDILGPCKEFRDTVEGRVVSVHVRRGDYLQNAANHHNLSNEWFKEAMDEFDDVTYLVFSDDIEWCKTQDMFSGDNVMFSETEDGKVITRDGRWESKNMDHWYDLCIQSLCDDHIISNSTFSWWGAYLNNSKDKKVVAPSKWFGPNNAHLKTKDLYPEGWKVI